MGTLLVGLALLAATETPAAMAKPADCALYSVVAVDFAKREISPSLPAGLTLVGDRTAGPSFYLDQFQIRTDTAEAGSLDSEVLESLRGRNAAEHPFPSDCDLSPALRVVPASEISQAVESYPTQPQLKAARVLRFWRPGLTADGHHALLRFWFGPTAHGAVGTYYLERRGSDWAIVWSRLSFYA